MSEAKDRASDPSQWRVEPSGSGNIGLQNAVESLAVNPLPARSSAPTRSNSSALGFGNDHTNGSEPEPFINRIWIGALGKISTESWPDEVKEKVAKNVWGNGNCCIPVFLTAEEIEGHYSQFCKQVGVNDGFLQLLSCLTLGKTQVLWKPFHYQLSDYPKGQAYEELAWRQYVAVNRKFANVIVENYQPTDISNYPNNVVSASRC
jgi:trehalose-6-phosphate synthase